MSNRPEFNSNGGRIRYINSPACDMYGNNIYYADDRSDIRQFDQSTGLRVGQSVVVTENAPANAPTPTPAPGIFRVTVAAYDDHGAPPPLLTFQVGRSIASLRNDRDVIGRLNVNADMVATVDHVLCNDSTLPTNGSVVTFKERNKRRG
jgi:hypothetical protein